MYYAYKDVRTEQAWSLWKHAHEDCNRTEKTQWPTFDQWKVQIARTYTLAQVSAEKSLVIAAMENVDPDTLQSAVNEVMECRAVVLWADCMSKPDQRIDPTVFTEIKKHCRAIVEVITAESLWRAPILSRLIRRVDLEWRETARQGCWCAALRYHVTNHPRYQRLLHYRQRCHDEWLTARPISFLPFPAWLACADAYCVARNA